MREQLYWKGVPVPYVARWSSELYQRIEPDKNASGMEAIFCSGGRGIGEPVWAQMEESRQRETVWQRRCQVCNCKLSGERMFGMDVPEYMEHQGERLPVLREPPVCSACAKRTLTLCPGTQRRHQQGILCIYEVLESFPIAALLGHIENGTEELIRVLGPGQTCVGMLKVVLSRYRVLTFEELRSELGLSGGR